MMMMMMMMKRQTFSKTNDRFARVLLSTVILFLLGCLFLCTLQRGPIVFLTVFVPIAMLGARILFGSISNKKGSAASKPSAKVRATSAGACFIDHSDVRSVVQILESGSQQIRPPVKFTETVEVYDFRGKICHNGVSPTERKATVMIRATYSNGLAHLHPNSPGKTSAILFCNLYKSGSGVQIDYTWAGPPGAVSDRWTYDWQVLDHLLNRTKTLLDGAPTSTSSRSAAITASDWLAADQSTTESPKWSRSYKGHTNSCRGGVHWPSPQDYSEAVQNPHSGFRDKDLASCSVEEDSIGLPRVASGNFASVYRLSSGDTQWAVRCFTQRLTDQATRYEAISNFILSDDLPQTLDFDYLSEGICVSGQWFPVLKMSWVDGETLECYVQRNLKNRKLLEKLRNDFADFMEGMKRNGIAHGDLQHGNILVNDNGLFVVDYDGVYVPELAGLKSNELGHPNYQHPDRSADHFGPYLDNFSAWVLDLTLACLIEDPELWMLCRGGDDCLLFKKIDFVNAERSAVFDLLSKHHHATVRAAATTLLAMLKLRPEHVPYLEHTGKPLKVPHNTPAAHSR